MLPKNSDCEVTNHATELSLSNKEDALLQAAIMPVLQAQLSHTTVQMQALAADMIHARGDLDRKSVRLMHSHYGNVRYILAYAAAGETITFQAITTDGEVRGYTSHSSQECLCYPPFIRALSQLHLIGARPPRGSCALEWQVRAAVLVR